jgi:hypothetical protein
VITGGTVKVVFGKIVIVELGGGRLVVDEGKEEDIELEILDIEGTETLELAALAVVDVVFRTGVVLGAELEVVFGNSVNEVLGEVRPLPLSGWPVWVKGGVENAVDVDELLRIDDKLIEEVVGAEVEFVNDMEEVSTELDVTVVVVVVVVSTVSVTSARVRM